MPGEIGKETAVVNKCNEATVAQIHKAFYAGMSVRKAALFAGADKNTVQRYFAERRSVSPQAFGTAAADTAIAVSLQGGSATAADGEVRSRPMWKNQMAATLQAIIERRDFSWCVCLNKEVGSQSQ